MFEAIPAPDHAVLLGEAEQAAGNLEAAASAYQEAATAFERLEAAGVNASTELAVFEADHGSVVGAAEIGKRAWRLTPSVRAADAYSWALSAAGRDAPRCASRGRQCDSGRSTRSSSTTRGSSPSGRAISSGRACCWGGCSIRAPGSARCLRRGRKQRSARSPRRGPSGKPAYQLSPDLARGDPVGVRGRYPVQAVTTPSRPASASSLDRVVSALKSRGLRASASRRMIIQILREAVGPLSAREISRGPDGGSIGLDLASVYRNLEVLEKHGLVHHIHAGQGPGRYVLAGSGEREYLACERCGATAGVDSRRIRWRAGSGARAVRLRGQLQACADGRALPRMSDRLRGSRGARSGS